MRVLVEAGCLISPKSVLDPVQLVSFLGKALNLATRTVACHTQGRLQLWVGWMRLALGEGNGRHLRSYLAKLARAPAWSGMPFWRQGMVLAPVGSDGGQGAATEPGPAC